MVLKIKPRLSLVMTVAVILVLTSWTSKVLKKLDSEILFPTG